MNEVTPIAPHTSHCRRYDEDMTTSFQYEDGCELVERQQEENHNTPLPDHSDNESFNFALMTIFLLGSCGAALVMLPIMVSCENHHIYDILYVVTFIFIGLLTLLCGFFIVRRKQWLADGLIKANTMTNSLSNIGQSSEQPTPPSGYLHLQQLPVYESSISRSQQKAFPYVVVAFGICSFLYQACVLIYHTVSSLKNTHSDYYLSKLYDRYHLVSDILFLIATITTIVFVTKFKGVTLHSCVIFHYFIALMIGGSVFIWFFLALSPVYVVISESCYNASSHCNSTRAKEAVESILDFLKPFQIEFITICIGIFMNLWNKFDNTLVKPENVDVLPSRVNPDNLDRNVNRQSIAEDSSESERCGETQASSTVTRRVIFIIPLLLPLFNVILYVVGHYVPYIHRGVSVPIVLWLVIYFLCHLLLILFFITTRRAMRKYTLRLKLTSMTCSEIVLIGTHTVTYVYYFFRFFAALSLLSSTESNVRNTKVIFIMIYSGLGMVDTWCATYYILAMKRLQLFGWKMTNFDKFGVIYNAAVHLSQWAITGLAHEWTPQTTVYQVPALVATFGNEAIRIVLLVVYPIIEFYRFHAAVLCIEIEKKG